MGIMVGDHDTSIGHDSSYSSLYRISEFFIHPDFNSDTNANDIALVKSQKPLTFSKGVQAACLPFQFTNMSLVSRNVQAVGW